MQPTQKLIRAALGGLALLTVLAGRTAFAANAPAQASEFGAPLIVNGKRIPDDEIKRFLIYTVGRNLIAVHKFGLIVDDELRQRAWRAATKEADEARASDAAMSEERLAEVRDGAYQRRLAALRAQFAVSDEAFEEERHRKVHEFEERYPVLDTDAEIARAFGSKEEFERQLRQQMLFDAVFLPINPAEWPDVTVQAFLADPVGGDLLLEDAKVSYQMRMDTMEQRELDRLPPDDDLLLNIHRQIVRDAIYQLVDFRTAADGLPPDQILWADASGDGEADLELSTAQMWAEVKPLVVERDVRQAKRWWALYTAAHDRMVEDGMLLDPGECDAVMAEYASGYDELVFSVEAAVVQTNGFPAMEVFRPYYCLLKGYERKVMPELIDANGVATEKLKAHLPVARMIYGLGQVDTEVLLVSAYDIGKNKWKEDGWRRAEAKANALMEQIESHRSEYAESRKQEKLNEAMGTPGAPSISLPDAAVFWSQLLDDNSDWWDPPPPAKGGKQADVTYKKSGRFGMKYRNDLLGFMGETPFHDFLHGGTLTDYAFFEQDPGTVSGPFCGPLGYYIVKVVRRTSPTRPVSPNEPAHLERLLEDYFRVAFRDNCQDALRQADVQGLPERCGTDA
jgi:hypothetical protein